MKGYNLPDDVSPNSVDAPWNKDDVENISLEELEATADFYDKIMEGGNNFYKNKKLMPGQE